MPWGQIDSVIMTTAETAEPSQHDGPPACAPVGASKQCSGYCFMDDGLMGSCLPERIASLALLSMVVIVLLGFVGCVWSSWRVLEQALSRW